MSLNPSSLAVTSASTITPPTTPPPSRLQRSKRPLSPPTSIHIPATTTTMPMTPPPTAPSSPRASPDITRCIGMSHLGLPSSLSHPKALEIYNQFKVFPWDVTCLNLLTHRRKIFGDVLSTSCATTKKVEYLVELRFLAKALRGWIEVAFDRSPHCLSPADKHFVLVSIANAYAEIPIVIKELEALKEKTYSSSVKSYCDEVCSCLREIYNSSEAQMLYKHVAKQQQSRQQQQA